MITVWMLTIGFAMSGGSSNQKFGPYETLELCQKAAKDTFVFDNTIHYGLTEVFHSRPLACTPEYRKSESAQPSN